MKDLVEKVRFNVTIKFNNNTEIQMRYGQVFDVPNLINYITAIDIDESTNTQNNNPVGVVSSNTLKLELNSKDKSLFPENTDSPYYGLMDNTAKVWVTLIDDDGVVFFNSFYVSNWRSNITAQRPNKVIIECTDVLSIISKNNIPSGVITQRLSTKEAFIYMLDKVNAQLGTKHLVKYHKDKIMFGEFNNLEYNNLDTSNIGDWLNTLSQCTLTNIYFGRTDNLIQTDYCLDDTTSESVCTLSDKINITDASVDTGGLVNYTGVKTTYITNTINNTDKLVTLSNQVIKNGVNKFDDINLGSKIFRINTIRLNYNADTKLEIAKVEYDKRNCNLEIVSTSEEDINCTIEIYGQSLKENTLSVTKVKSSSNEMLNVTNKLILPEYAEIYTDNLLKLIGIRNSTISVTGFFNPRIKLGDTVYVDAEKSINTKGYYKVIGLKWRIRDTIKCTAKLIKTII